MNKYMMSNTKVKKL